MGRRDVDASRAPTPSAPAATGCTSTATTARSRDAWVGESLLYVLRERLGLLGSKGACEQGECGSCSVLVDGAAGVHLPRAGGRARSVSEIVTVEGSRRAGAPTDVQQAFVDAGAVQCGFCTPGLIMAAHDLLERNADADRAARSARRCRATSAAAPATAGSSTRCSAWPSRVAARRVVSDDRRRPTIRRAPPVDRGRLGDSAGPARRHRQGAGPFAFSGDLGADGMLWGAHAALAAPVRPHRRASTSSAAWQIAGVEAVVTADDVPGQADLRADRAGPAGVRRATSSATSASRSLPSPPTIPRRAGGRSRRSSSSTRCSSRSTDPERGDRRHAPADPSRRQRDPPPADRARRPDGRRARSSSRAPTRSACRTRRSSASRPRSRCPTRGGDGVELFVATQWLHEDRKQIAACLGLAPRRRCASTLGGVGGAFGAREDISLQVHTCLLALRTGRPVRMRVQPRGELPRPRAPPPGDDLDAPPRRPRRADRQRSRPGSSSTAAPTRRRRRRC